MQVALPYVWFVHIGVPEQALGWLSLGLELILVILYMIVEFV